MMQLKINKSAFSLVFSTTSNKRTAFPPHLLWFWLLIFFTIYQYFLKRRTIEIIPLSGEAREFLTFRTLGQKKMKKGLLKYWHHLQNHCWEFNSFIHTIKKIKVTQTMCYFFNIYIFTFLNNICIIKYEKYD